MKKLGTLLLLIMGLSALSYAQTKITGTVKDGKGKALAGTSISIKDTYDGATTDEKGYFSFTTTEKGDAVLSVNSPGFAPYEKVITIAGESLSVPIMLMTEIVEELTAATVTAGSFEAGDKKRAATVLSSMDILTTGGANADITGAIKTLPGAQLLGDQEGLAVRGGSVYETKQYIDGTVVSKPYYSGPANMPQRGRFSPTLFKGTVFSTGGYSALYGEALSSALILESIDLPTMSQANLAISNVFVGGGYQQLAQNKKSSWGLDGSYTNVGPYFNLVKQEFDFYESPIYYTLDGNFRVRTKRGGMVKFYTNYTNNSMGVLQPNIDDARLDDALTVQNNNLYTNLSWREYFGRNWKMDLGLSYSYNEDKYAQELRDSSGNKATGVPALMDSLYTYNINSRQNFTQVKLVLEKKLAGLNAIRFGGEYWYEDIKNRFDSYQLPLSDNFAAIFAEANLHITNKWAVTLGARGEYSSVIGTANIAPRLAFAYKTGKSSQISAAYGMFYQKPDNAALINTTELGYQQASHYILNYSYNPMGRTMRVEAFYKTYDDLVKTAPQYSNNGDGYARGVEVYWRDKKLARSFDYWLSYSFLDTKRDYLNYPEELQPNFAATHTATMVVKYFVSPLQTGINLTYSYATGRPYYNLMRSAGSQSYYIADQGKTISYNDLGASLNYVTSWKKAFVVVVASVTNILGQDHVYNYKYSTNGMVKQPVMPTADRFYFLGVFFSWGVDRTQDVIDGRY